MGWTKGVPEGVSEVRNDGTQISAKVAMPESEDGYSGCECPACTRFFKVMISEYDALPDGPINCPYCGRSDGTGEFMTGQQQSRVTAGAEAVAEQWVHAQLDDIFDRAFRGSKAMSYTSGSRPPRRTLPAYVEEAPAITRPFTVRVRSATSAALGMPPPLWLRSSRRSGLPWHWRTNSAKSSARIPVRTACSTGSLGTR
jgi:hypothetical protein